MAKISKIQREKQTVEAMIRIFCKAQHQSAGTSICDNCRELLEYARVRLDKCPYAPEKPPCSKCQTHCYKPQLRQQIIKVMKYAGPRMIATHPIMAIRHLSRKLKK